MQRSTLRRFVPRPTYANVIATIALFVALGGVAVAAGLPKNSVGPRQLKRGAVNAAKIRPGAVNTAKLRRNAVTAGKIRRGAVTPGKLGPNAVLPGNLGNGIISTAKLANGAVNAAKIRNGVVTSNKIKREAVTTAKLANGSVNVNKLADGAVTRAKLNFPVAAPGEVSTLAAGQTLRGVFDLGGTAVAAGEIAKAAVSYSAPLAAPPVAATVLLPGQATAGCPGLGAGNTPLAAAGNLCLYLLAGPNLAEPLPTAGLKAEASTQLGFGLSAQAKAAGDFWAIGLWAVTPA